MPARQVVIIGAGLSGLYAASMLEKKGVDYVLLEARSALGGRILSGSVAHDVERHDPSGTADDSHGLVAMTVNSCHRFDLGPTWFWPEFQPTLAGIIRELGLETFEQYETGDTLVEQLAGQPARRVPGYINSPTSVRLVGSMHALVQALQKLLDPARLCTDQVVLSIRTSGDVVEIESQDRVTGMTTVTTAQHVLLALPPRLAANIEFWPALPVDLTRQWQATPTWMAPHAKYIAVYDTAFWRDMNLSGQARSSLGPMVEIHDASVADAGSGAGAGAGTRSGAALFGFIGVPAQVRRGVAESVMKAHCRTQLVRLFGAQAENPRAEFLKDWSQDLLTTTDADLTQQAQGHASAPMSRPDAGPWRTRLTGIGSEWSSEFPGYLAGAVDAAIRGVAALPRLKQPD